MPAHLVIMRKITGANIETTGTLFFAQQQVLACVVFLDYDTWQHIFYLRRVVFRTKRKQNLMPRKRSLSLEGRNDIISNKNSIRLTLSTCNGVPDTWVPEKLEPVGYAVFIGDKLHAKISVNDKFEKGKEYAVYEFQRVLFAVCKAGTGHRFNSDAWRICS
jgi:hypothetical protein